MKYFSYYFQNLYYIVYLALTIVAFFKNENLLIFLSTAAMYTIALIILSISRRKKIDIEIKSIIKNNECKTVNLVPIYIISFTFIMLALLQNIHILKFSKINNLFLSLIINVYMIYENEKAYKVKLEYEKEKEKYIKKYGEDEFNKMIKKHDKFLKEIEEEFENILKENKKDTKRGEK